MPAPGVSQPSGVGLPGPLLLDFSLGATGAAPGSPAALGVVVTDPTGIPSPNIFPAGTPITLTTVLRTAGTFGGLLVPAVLAATVFHHIQNIETGAVLPPVAGGAIAVTPPPAGAPPPPPGVTTWFTATSPPITLAAGTYRVLTHVHGTGAPASVLQCFHDGTILMASPPGPP